MAPDYLLNFTGLAETNVNNQWITYYIFNPVLTLFAVPLYVQLNIILNHALFCKIFHFVHGIFQHTFYKITGIYRLAWECKNISVQQDKTTQWNKQVLPPIDEFISIPDFTNDYSLPKIFTPTYNRRVFHCTGSSAELSTGTNRSTKGL